MKDHDPESLAERCAKHIRESMNSEEALRLVKMTTSLAMYEVIERLVKTDELKKEQ